MTLREKVLKAAAFDGQAFEKACLDNGYQPEFAYHQKIIRSSENQRLLPLIEALAEVSDAANEWKYATSVQGPVYLSILWDALAKLEALLKEGSDD